MWHKRHAPSRRSNTIARPLAGVASRSGQRSRDRRHRQPNKVGSEPASAIAVKPDAANSVAATTAVLGSAEGFGRDRAEPRFRISRFEATEVGWCVGRAHPPGTLDINELPVDRMVNAGDRDPVIRALPGYNRC